VVLDEADEMLNMGFQDDIELILKNTPQRESTWLFSATMPPDSSPVFASADCYVYRSFIRILLTLPIFKAGIVGSETTMCFRLSVFLRMSSISSWKPI